MGKLAVIGLGSTDILGIENDALEKIKESDNIYFRTKKHRAFSDLCRLLNRDLNSFDYLYDEIDDFQKVEEEISEFVYNAVVNLDEDFTYIVPGSPFLLEKSVELLSEKISDIEFFNGKSSIDLVLSRINCFSDGLDIVSAKDFNKNSVDYSKDTIIFEIDDEILMDEIISALSDCVPGDAEIAIVKDGGLDTEEIFKGEISHYRRNIKPNHQTTLVLKKLSGRCHNFSDLLDTADKLRGPDGCPWDSTQTFDSLKSCLIEETFEVIKAVENDDIDNISEELGDLLYLIVLFSRIGFDDGYFSIENIISNVIYKLKCRHSNIFNNFELDKSQELMQNWDSTKYKSRGINTFWERLDDLKGMPSTLRAYSTIKKVTEIGFDWEDRHQAFEKVKEEFYEAYDAKNEKELEEELGDLMFSVCNLINFCGFEPEILLNKATDKFVERFRIMENIAESENRDIMNLKTSELEDLWQMSKKYR